MFNFGLRTSLYYEKEQGRAFGARLMSGVAVVSAAAHARRRCSSGACGFNKGHRVQLMCSWVKERQVEEGKFRGDRKFQVNAENKREIETSQTPVFFPKIILKDYLNVKM